MDHTGFGAVVAVVQRRFLDHLAVFGHDAEAFPAGPRFRGFHLLLGAVGEVGIFLKHVIRGGRFAYLLGADGDLDPVLQDRKAHDGYFQQVVLKIGAQGDGGRVGIHKFQIGAGVAVEADHGVLPGLHIAGGEAVGIALRGHEAGGDDGVVQSGGDLADAAARLLNQHAVLVGSGRLIALLTGAVSGGQVEGKFLSGLQNPSVNGVHGQLDVLVAVFVVGRLGGEGADHLVLFLGLSLGALRRDNGQGRGNGGGVGIGIHGSQHIGSQLVPVQLKPADFLAILVLAGFAVVGYQLGILRRAVEMAGKFVRRFTDSPLHGFQVKGVILGRGLTGGVNFIQNPPDLRFQRVREGQAVVLPDHGHVPGKCLGQLLFSRAAVQAGEIHALDRDGGCGRKGGRFHRGVRSVGGGRGGLFGFPSVLSENGPRREGQDRHEYGKGEYEAS